MTPEVRHNEMHEDTFWGKTHLVHTECPFCIYIYAYTCVHAYAYDTLAYTCTSVGTSSAFAANTTTFNIIQSSWPYLHAHSATAKSAMDYLDARCLVVAWA